MVEARGFEPLFASMGSEEIRERLRSLMGAHIGRYRHLADLLGRGISIGINLFSPMAFIFKNPNSPNWLAGFRDASGKRRNRSTGIENKEKHRRAAERIADEYEATARNRRTSQQVRRAMSELHQEITGEEVPTVTLRSHVEAWLRSKEPSVAASSMAFYTTATTKFLNHLGERAEVELIDITREDIEGFRDTLAKRLAPKTVNHHVKALRMVFRDARDRRVLVDDPTEFVKSVKSKRVVERRPFTIEEIRKVLDHCDDEWRSMVVCALYTGQRLGDIARLRWNQVDLKREAISITTSKTGKTINLPLHPSLLEHLRSLPSPLSDDLPLHPRASEVVEAQGRVGSLSREFGEILAKAKLRDKKSHKATEDGKGRAAKRSLSPLTFHSLRRTAATMLHEAGVSQAVAMALIGHDSEDIHSIYVNVGETAMRDAAKKLPAV